MSRIKEVRAREILDSRGNPTVEAEVKTERGIFRASVPSGASTGIYEACELRDNDKRYNGKGVLKAVNNVNKIIAQNLIGKNPENQEEIDRIMINLDSTENKSRLGANAILAVSLAVCRAGAASKGIPLYKHLAKISGNKLSLPIPSFNIINGGKHAGNKLAIQEFMIMPVKISSFKESLRCCTEVYHLLKKIIEDKYGISQTNVGDEGGFAPDLRETEECLKLINNSIEKAGYKNKIKIALDIAASEFYSNGKYDLSFKDKTRNLKTGEEMIKFYSDLIKNYDIISIEDPFEQDDFSNWEKITKELKDIQIVGDDLLVTNPKRIKIATEKKLCNCLLLKVNQIGTITEAIEATNIAKKAGWKVMVSHRSGETEDNFIADLAAGLGADKIKSGAPCRSERTSKYNQLLRIEEEISN